VGVAETTVVSRIDGGCTLLTASFKKVERGGDREILKASVVANVLSGISFPERGFKVTVKDLRVGGQRAGDFNRNFFGNQPVESIKENFKWQ